MSPSRPVSKGSVTRARGWSRGASMATQHASLQLPHTPRSKGLRCEYNSLISSDVVLLEHTSE